MAKKEVKEFIEERKKLEIKIKQLEREHISDDTTIGNDTTIGELYTKLIYLMGMRGKLLQLDDKIKTIERLAPKQQ